MEIIHIEHKGFKYNYCVHKAANPTMNPIFFVSGAFQNKFSWRMVYEIFQDEADFIIADIPGSGSGDFLPAEYSFEFLADCICKILMQENFPPVYMIAASYGTPIAYSFAQKFPKQICKLSLAGTMKDIPIHIRHHIVRSVELIENESLQVFADYALNNGFMCNLDDSETLIHQHDLIRSLMERQMLKMKPLDIKKYIANTNRILYHGYLDFSNPPVVDTLIFTGEYDTFTTPTLCKEFSMAMPNSTFTTIPNADHIFHLQQPKITKKLLYDFAKSKKKESTSSHTIKPIEKFSLGQQMLINSIRAI